HLSLLLTVADQPAHVPFKVSGALLTFGTSVALRRLAVPGAPVMLAPDRRRVVFLPFDGSAQSANPNAAPGTGVIHLKLFEVATGKVTSLATSDPQLPVGLSGFAD